MNRFLSFSSRGHFRISLTQLGLDDKGPKKSPVNGRSLPICFLRPLGDSGKGTWKWRGCREERCWEVPEKDAFPALYQLGSDLN